MKSKINAFLNKESKNMSKTLLKTALFLLAAVPAAMTAQVDLTIGLNYSYNPPNNCDNQFTGITVDICNNGSSSSGSFLVGIYLYNPSTQEHWVLDQTTVNSLSGSACVTINNWDIDMNQYPSLPGPGTNYRVGVWADTANVISESNENNNASLLSGNIQVCAASTGIKNQNIFVSAFDVYPNPSALQSNFKFTLAREEKTEIVISDITGKPVSTVFNGNLQPGSHTIRFNSGELAAGIYFASIKTPGGSVSRKLIVQK
ncbi:MAG: hypothetical protein K0S32_1512 [Bacteroidetes bacterium]|jgi:hypothetical protein|nr:hypothetical protein [Bacteroidota bacterium]